jgi:N-acetylneuraminate synthase
MSVVKVGNKIVSNEAPTYLIAEIGINHNGDLETAKKLIHESKNAGFDAVKFQKRTIEIVYTPEELSKPRPNFFGETNGDLKRGLEFQEQDYREIDRFCREIDIQWFASPWDLPSVEFLENFNVVAHKVASACMTDRSLLKALNATGKPVFMSTGMSTLAQVDAAVNEIDNSRLILMHTVSVYPAKPEQLNLSWIEVLKRRYPNIPIGYSGHEVGVTPSVVAVAKYGATCVERHVTLDRSMWGSDQSASLEPDGMKRVVGYIRSIPVVSGHGEKHILDEEVPISAKLRRVTDF